MLVFILLHACVHVCVGMCKMVENLCSHKMSAQLYAQLRVACESHVSSCVNQFLSYPLLTGPAAVLYH